ncbi:RabGAP/TBC protein [Sparassis crispa]|uniref:RabGAP/TBC protein n=1 Tax=Sparassis crispa TaxID=139825 RepID=A0A401GD02_9APHY|nr:RabGAP/TBC protein [Sparassis crispa]GBE80030.1 RabGAP/TBC protein [Sparassis crispa]
MTERTRPDVKEIKDAYDYLFNSAFNMSKIKDAALGGRLFRGSDDADGVPGRSMAWKLFLLQAEPLQMPHDVVAIAPLESLRVSRKEYTKLLLEKMRSPDGSYEEGLVIPGLATSPPRVDLSKQNLEKNNPLSLHDENPWTKWFESVDLRKTILQDVERTFPDVGYFRDPEVQAQLTNILFVHSVMHPDVGYRQGMHELLAPLYFAVDYDSVTEDEPGLDDSPVKEFCSRTWVASDAWSLFVSVMRGVGRWYEWRESQSPADTSPLGSHVQLNIPSGETRLKPYVAPIVDACNRIQSTYLKSVDPELWRRMQSAGIEPQIYGIRWLRLLFTREFSMQDAMIIWDGLFACDPSFDLAQWLCVAMLIRIRNQLIPSDYSGQLTYLLRYPSQPPSAEAPAVHHATLLLHQALTLQMSPSPAAGVSVIHENRNLLSIPIEVPEPSPPPPMRRRQRPGEWGMSFSSEAASRAGQSSKSAHGRQQSTPLGLSEMLARGLLERGESLGINKTVMNAVSELKRNLPDLTNSLGRFPMTPQTAYAAYPLTDERLPSERPPWESRIRFEVDREVAQMQSLQKRLGDSVSWIVDTLLLDESTGPNEDRARAVQNRKREALECLSYVRDVLRGTVTVVEEERLVGEEEFKRRQAKEEQLAMPAPPQPAAPPPAETRPQALGSGMPSDYFSSTMRSQSRASIPVARLSPQPPSSTASPSLSTPNSKGVPMAPWNHTRSNFSSKAPPIPNLPRLPPRTSTATHPGVVPSAYTPPLRPSPVVESATSPGYPPRHGVQQDPLGALP